MHKKYLRRTITVIAILAMLAGICAVPALASGFQHEAEAKILNNLSLMEGMGLGDPVNRIQGLIFALKAAGLKDEVEALTDSEAARILENVIDAAEIPTWGRKWAAYAVKNNYTTGVDASIHPRIKFAPLQEVSGRAFLTWILKIGMGYSDVGTNNAVDVAVKSGVISKAQAGELEIKTALIRDDAAGILYGACKNGVNADGTAFIQSLVNIGFIPMDKAVDAGFTVSPPVKEIGIDKVEAIAQDKIAITLKGEFNSFVAEDLLVTRRASIKESKGDFASDPQTIKITHASTSLIGRNTVVTLTLAEKLACDLNTPVYVFVVGNASKNNYGQTLKVDYNKAYPVADRIAPVLYDDGDKDTPKSYEKENGRVADYLDVNIDRNLFTLYFSEGLQAYNAEELKKAGEDLVLVMGGKQLVNGKDYEVYSIIHDKVTIMLLSDDYIGYDGEIRIRTADKVNYLKDYNGNAVAPFDIKAEVVLAGAFKTVMITAPDTVEITITEKLAGWKGDFDSFLTFELEGKKTALKHYEVKEDKIILKLGRNLAPGEQFRVVYKPTGESGLIDLKGIFVYEFSFTMIR